MKDGISAPGEQGSFGCVGVQASSNGFVGTLVAAPVKQDGAFVEGIAHICRDGFEIRNPLGRFAQAVSRLAENRQSVPLGGNAPV